VAEYFEDYFIKVTWDAPAENTPDGYYVFRDETMITDEIWSSTLFVDEVTDNEDHCYTVTAVYGEEQSGHSNKSCNKVPVGIVSITNYELRIYPNPTTGELTVAMSGERYAICDIAIYDIYGSKVEISHFACNDIIPNEAQRNEESLTINISHLSCGIYFLKIDTEQGTVVKKLIKI
jgi:hypothetical protein